MANTRRSRAPAGPAPTPDKLEAAALAHVARYATTEAGLARVLDRRIARWERAAKEADPAPEAAEATSHAAATARAAVRAVVQRLTAAGALDDAAFAASRARRLTRAGHSRRAVAAHLAARGIGGEAARAALPETDELAAAVMLARRRRMGPFRKADVDDAAALRELGVLARAGFPREVAERALRMDTDDAEELALRLRQT